MDSVVFHLASDRICTARRHGKCGGARRDGCRVHDHVHVAIDGACRHRAWFGWIPLISGKKKCIFRVLPCISLSSGYPKPEYTSFVFYMYFACILKSEYKLFLKDFIYSIPMYLNLGLCILLAMTSSGQLFFEVCISLYFGVFLLYFPRLFRLYSATECKISWWNTARIHQNTPKYTKIVIRVRITPYSGAKLPYPVVALVFE